MITISIKNSETGSQDYLATTSSTTSESEYTTYSLDLIGRSQRTQKSSESLSTFTQSMTSTERTLNLTIRLLNQTTNLPIFDLYNLGAIA